ncbi:ATP-binding protein [Bacillus licheniformis]|nr:ATP-binding protein [Bacillus licheniformis]
MKRRKCCTISMQKECEGSGLGLAISLELVHLHDGCIAVDSRTGRGTEITMEFKKNPKAAK